MSWLGTIFIIISIWRISHKDRWAFLIGAMGSGLWAIQGTTTGQLDLVVVNIIILILQINSFLKWGKLA